MDSLKQMIKNIVSFKEPEPDEHFILAEDENEKDNEKQLGQNKTGQQKKRKNEKMLLNMDKIQKNSHEESKQDKRVSIHLSENFEFIKYKFSIPLNSDVVIREFDIIINGGALAAFIVFFDGMVDRKLINDNILQPLMLLSNLNIKSDEAGAAEFIRSHLIPHNQLNEVREYSRVIDEINFGGCAVFIDGIDSAFTADVKGFEHRSVERPNTELVIRGPQEGFTEVIRVNTALIRKRLKDEDLIVENIEIGERSKTPCAMMYIRDIANESLVKEVRKRLKSIKIDYLNTSGELEQFIEDSTFLAAPQVLSTERPDSAAISLTEGKVVVLVNGSPFAIAMPVSFHELMHASEDVYTRFPNTILLRLIRQLGLLMALLLPGVYIAITNYHQEMIPTSLLLAIGASRERVPFPSIAEIFMMEVAFELIREAGIRIPGPIGPTLGIVGALILGQAAVAANIISPILIIVVAVTGIGSFALPNFSLAFGFRFLRFGYIFLGSIAGFLGIATGLFIHGVMFCKSKSFGVPFMVPLGPVTSGSFIDSVFRYPLWKVEKRPDYMNTKDIRSQPKVSRGWTDEKDGSDRQGGE